MLELIYDPRDGYIVLLSTLNDSHLEREIRTLKLSLIDVC